LLIDDPAPELIGEAEFGYELYCGLGFGATAVLAGVGEVVGGGLYTLGSGYGLIEGESNGEKK